MFETAPSRVRRQGATACPVRLGKHVWLTLAVLWVCAGWNEQARGEPGRMEVGAMVAPSLDKHAGARRFAHHTYKEGWSAGAALRYGLSDAWAMQVEILHATRGSDVTSEGELINAFNFRYVQVPLLARYEFAVPGMAEDGRPTLRLHLVAGPTLSILLRAEDIDDQTFFPRSSVGSLDVSVMAGLGLTWRMVPRWAASLEVRFDRGFLDTFPETARLETKNQAILLALGIGYTLDDGDGDGVAGPRDRCPAADEDWNDYQDADGCPDDDNDRDGVAVGDDQCIEVAEDRDDFADEDGCPDPDNDGDGFLDEADMCPTDAFPRMRGCPPRLERVRIAGDRLVLDPALEFDRNELTLTAEQELALDQVATLMTDYYPDMLLRLEGHADGEGQKDANERLSAGRARAVAAYLMQAKGIEAERLVEKGYGEDRPIRREEGVGSRRENRRVELVIIALERK